MHGLSPYNVPCLWVAASPGVENGSHTSSSASPKDPRHRNHTTCAGLGGTKRHKQPDNWTKYMKRCLQMRRGARHGSVASERKKQSRAASRGGAGAQRTAPGCARRGRRGAELRRPRSEMRRQPEVLGGAHGSRQLPGKMPSNSPRGCILQYTRILDVQ